MDLKRLITHCTYRIEPKPEGGFIAHPSDPTVATLEAPTREELQQKIQANIVNTLSTAFPGLNLPTGKQLSYAFHIESKPGGGFAIHSADPNAKTIEGASHAEIENPFAEKLLDFVGKHLAPEFTKALLAAGNVQVFVNTKAEVDLNSPDLKLASLPSQKASFTASIVESSSKQPADAKIVSTSFGNRAELAGNSPITPETGNWNFFRILFALLVLAAVMYFFLHHS